MKEDDIDADTVDVDPVVADLFHTGRVATAIIENRDEIPSPDEFLTEILKLHSETVTSESDDKRDDTDRGYF